MSFAAIPFLLFPPCQPGGDNVTIVTLTAGAFTEQHKQILAAGCDEVVHTPFRSSELFSVMEKYLGVRYRYKEEQRNDTAEPLPTVTAALVDYLPAEQQERLRNAAQKLDIATAEEVIGTIHADHPKLAEELHRMVRAFPLWSAPETA